jgi:hypothetical protein
MVYVLASCKPPYSGCGFNSRLDMVMLFHVIVPFWLPRDVKLHQPYGFHMEIPLPTQAASTHSRLGQFVLFYRNSLGQ